MIEVRTPSRLHFGLLALDPSRPRQFGGVGLMVREPDLHERLADVGALSAATGRVRIEMEPGVDSLNVATAARL